MRGHQEFIHRAGRQIIAVGLASHPTRANTFEEIAEMSKQHGMEMFQKKDETHLKAMNLKTAVSRFQLRDLGGIDEVEEARYQRGYA